jgi:hypothetical protein
LEAASGGGHCFSERSARRDGKKTPRLAKQEEEVLIIRVYESGGGGHYVLEYIAPSFSTPREVVCTLVDANNNILAVETAWTNMNKVMFRKPFSAPVTAGGCHLR